METSLASKFTVDELIVELQKIQRKGFGRFYVGLEIEDNWDCGCYHYSLLSKDIESVTAYEDDKRVYLHGENE